MRKLIIPLFFFFTFAIGWCIADLSAADLTVKADAITTNNPTKTTVDVKKNLDIQSTGGIYLPSGTTAQQPAPYKPGMIRYNTTLGTAELYSGGVWGPIGAGGSSFEDWVGGEQYDAGDFVINSQRIYRALLDHTASGSFPTDLANGDWQEISPTGTINLASGVTGTLPISNGGTGSATKNFVDLTTNQTIAGNKTFTNDLTVNGITSLASSLTGPLKAVGGVVNAGAINLTSDVTAVLPLVNGGTGNTTGQAQTVVTNANLTGMVTSVGNATTVVTNANLTGMVTSVGNATSLGSFTSANLATALTDETGTGANVFATSPTLVTPTLGAASATSLAIGGTINANAVLDVQSTTKAFMPPRMTEAQMRAIPAPTAGMMVYNSDYGVTATYSGTAWGYNFGKLTGNQTYALTMTTTSGVISSNTDNFVASCTAANPSVCTFTAGKFTVAPTCVPGINPASSAAYMAQVRAVSASGFTVETMASTNGAAIASQPASILCTKNGNDYAAASASAYVSTNGNYSRRPYTPTFTGFGTVSNVSCYESREGEFNNIECNFTSGTVTATEARISLPTGLVTPSTVPTISLRGVMETGNIGAIGQNVGASYGVYVEPSLGYVTFGARSSGNTGLQKLQGTAIGSSLSYSITARVPINGWTNSNLIVGSFENIEKCANDNECESILSGNVTSANVVTLDNPNIPFISSASWSSGILTVNFNTGYFTVTPRCWAIPVGVGTGQRMVVTSVASTGVVFNNRANDGTATATPDSANIFCKKTGVDSKPKTAKIASSIGVPTVPGVVGVSTGQRIDLVSFKYGATISSACTSVGACPYVVQLAGSSGVVSFSKASSGVYTLVTQKNYTDFHCTGSVRGASNYAIAWITPAVNTNTFTIGTDTGAGTAVDSYGTINCFGAY